MNTTTKLKSIEEGFNSRLEEAEKRIIEFEPEQWNLPNYSSKKKEKEGKKK